MNQQDMIDTIHAQDGRLKKMDILSVLKLQGDVAAVALSGGHEVTLLGIGKLKPVSKAARTGRNPKTGEPLKIAARTAVKFVAAKVLKDAVA
jgi:DNA-binding protein HU-beta